MSGNCHAVAAVSASLFLTVGLAPCAKGQGAVPPEPRPYLYLWDAPAPGWQTPLLPYASRMVRVDARMAAVAAAQEAKAEIAAQVYGTPATTDENNICLVIEAFGMWYESDPDPSSFFHEDDSINPIPNWDPAEPDPSGDMFLKQPWMTKGREEAKEWMEAFLAELHSDVAVPTPLRYHFDTEVHIGGGWATNHSRILQAMAQDSRWSNTNFKVPGSAGYLGFSPTQDITMAQLYANAQAAFQWPEVPFLDWLDEDQNAIAPGHNHNRKIFIWYNEICDRAIDAAMKECAYDPIADFYAAHSLPVPKFSNYNHCDTDGKGGTFGWYTGRENTGSPVNNQSPPPLVPQRKGIQGIVEGAGAGSQYFWSDFVQYVPNTNPPVEVRRSMWDTHATTASGDFSSPVVYPPNPWNHWHPSQDRKNYYLPKAGVPLDWQDGAPGWMTVEHGRRNIESIINTTLSYNPPAIVPWVAPGGMFFSYDPPASYTWTHEDLRDALAMMRAKKIPEIIIWWNAINTPYTDWDTLQVVMDRVYIPQLNLIRVTSGTWNNPPAPPTTTPPVDRLRYTLPVQGDDNETFVGVNSTTGSLPQIVMTFRFGGLDAMIGSAPVTLNLECAVNLGGQGEISEIRGSIYVWNWVASQWELHPLNDFGGGIGTPGFGFFAPINDASPNLGNYETRRCFPGLQKYVNSAGNMDVKVVLQRSVSDHPFTARFDLVQLLGEPEALSSMMGQPQGADFNHTQEVSLVDIDGFYAAYNAGEIAADFNNDGVVTPQDLTEYTTAYINSP